MSNKEKTQTLKLTIIKDVTLNQVTGLPILNGTLDINDKISNITTNLGEIFRFYRFKSIHLKIPPFNSEQFLTGDTYNMALTYVPADTNTNLPANMAEIEGTNVSLIASNVLAFQHFHVGKRTLQSQNYKWWTTNGFVSTDEDDQGRIVFVTSSSFPSTPAYRVTMQIDLVIEYKTLLDPALM
jgi:hypothetical protein